MTVFANNKNALILFTKEPIPGKVKTRLIPSLGITGAYKLYCKLLNIILDRFKDINYASFIIYTYPQIKTKPSYFQNYPTVKIQSGDDLGEKMYHALAQELHCFNKVILFGADCPFISHQIIFNVFEKLETHDLVFVPTHDGGYVLIAAKKINYLVFKDVQWSTAQVMQQTCRQMDKLNLSYFLLDPLVDIDNAEDLIHLEMENFYEA